MDRQVEGQVWRQVENQVWNQMDRQVESQVREQVREQVWKKMEFYSWGYYGDVWDYGWMSFYNFFEKLGIVKHKEYLSFKSLLNNDIFMTIQLDGLCLVSRKPIKIFRDTNNNLHSEESCAIEFRDGFKLWYLWGVNFEYELWESIINKTITPKEILALENMEQRMAAIKTYGAGNMVKELGAKCVDRGDVSLYYVDGLFDQRQYFITYTCPSTGRFYTKFVPPGIGDKGNAEECRLWGMGLELKDADKILIET
jgi:hypothetical protein